MDYDAVISLFLHVNVSKRHLSIFFVCIDYISNLPSIKILQVSNFMRGCSDVEKLSFSMTLLHHSKMQKVPHIFIRVIEYHFVDHDVIKVIA